MWYNTCTANGQCIYCITSRCELKKWISSVQTFADFNESYISRYVLLWKMKALCLQSPSCLVYSSILKMEAACSSKTSVTFARLYGSITRKIALLIAIAVKIWNSWYISNTAWFKMDRFKPKLNTPYFLHVHTMNKLNRYSVDGFGGEICEHSDGQPYRVFTYFFVRIWQCVITMAQML
jgi:hypothetical protein